MNKSQISPFTVVIPLIPQHDQEIKRILRLLANEQNLIQEVIICRSESRTSNSKIERKFLKFAKGAEFLKEIKVDCVRNIARDGTNRNRGWAQASSEYVAFMDADDLYSQNRLSVLLNLFTVSKADAIVHNYNSDGSPKSINPEEIPKSRRVELKNDLDGQAYMVDYLENELKVHYAHITVRNDLKSKIMFTDRFPGADWQFAVGVVKSGFDLEYVNEELSAWSRKRSIRYIIRIYRMRFVKKLKVFMSQKNQ